METANLLERPAHVPPERYLDFDIYQPLRDGLGFHESWSRLQAERKADLVWTPRNGGHWLALRGTLINQVLGEYVNFSNHTVLVPKATAGEAYRLIPLSLDPPAHAPFRNLLNTGMSPRAVKPIEDRIAALTISLIERFRRRGGCDFTTEFAEQLPITVFMSIVDLPEADTPKLKYLADQFTRPDGKMIYPEVVTMFTEYLAPIIAARRGGSGEDLITRMINGRVNDRALTDLEANNLCMQVLDTVVNFMAFVMLFMAEHPEHRRALATNPESIPGAVAELARRFPLVTVGREVTHDMEFEGVQLKAGEMVVCPTPLHGLDPTENAEPFNVDFGRPRIRHSTFGNGSHTCPGAHLARTELRIMLREWLARIPDFHVAPGHRTEFTGGIVGSVKSLRLAWDVASTQSGTEPSAGAGDPARR